MNSVPLQELQVTIHFASICSIKEGKAAGNKPHAIVHVIIMAIITNLADVIHNNKLSILYFFIAVYPHHELVI